MAVLPLQAGKGTPKPDFPCIRYSILAGTEEDTQTVKVDDSISRFVNSVRK